MGVQSLNYNWKVLKMLMTRAYNRSRRVFAGDIVGAFHPKKFGYETRYLRASRFLLDYGELFGFEEFGTRSGVPVYSTDEKYVRDILPKKTRKVSK